MGNEIFVYLMSGDTSYIARIDPRGHLQTGDKIDMVFNTDSIHLFDAEAENQPSLLTDA
jgi:multiple sugar transport system ATP-binding protein